MDHGIYVRADPQNGEVALAVRTKEHSEARSRRRGQLEAGAVSVDAPSDEPWR
jgi:hypothetical protein